MCERPRPRGAKRCFCNYTFEFDRRAGGVPVSRPRFDGLLIVLAVAAAIGAAAWLRTQPGIAGHASLGALLVAIGIFSIAGALFAWSWFLGNRRARWFMLLLGATGTRVVYALLGGALAGGGVVLLLA